MVILSKIRRGVVSQNGFGTSGSARCAAQLMGPPRYLFVCHGLILRRPKACKLDLGQQSSSPVWAAGTILGNFISEHPPHENH
jgi:hypothetical protein